VPLLVRSWNVFHGNTVPPVREARLERMVRLASADGPDVLLLQEVPAWALSRLAGWSGMEVVADMAEPARLGPLRWPAEAGRLVTSLHHGLLRSAVSGQGNAILLAPGTRVLERHRLTLNDPLFRRRQARWLGLPLLARLAWANERRICQAARVELPGGTRALVAHLHATSYRPDERLADAELLRAAVFADGLALPGEPCVLGGDLNVREGRSRTLAELRGEEWGFAGGGHGVDHLLVRGARLGRVERWPDERRRDGRALLSDHAPVEVAVG
jgi:endonuclease/exonuclease/phosphatase family metal-dependent hydrolase